MAVLLKSGGEAELRRMGCSMDGPPRFPFTPFPSGWFRVAASRQLGVGQRLRKRYFDRELLIARDRDGHASIHQGTSSLPVQEVNGQIMLYFGGDPIWRMPQLAEYQSAGWSHRGCANHWPALRTHVQEIAENAVDVAHLSRLHSQQIRDSQTDHFSADGPIFQHRIEVRYNVFKLARWLRTEVTGTVETTCCGLGCVATHSVVRARGLGLDYLYMFYATPIDEDTVEFNTALSARCSVGRRWLGWLLMAKAQREAQVMVDQDMGILESKLYRERPTLCDGDGPIMEFRRWARQFYPG